MTPETDAAIAAAWPARWAKAQRSKQRNNLRKCWDAHLAHTAFVALNPTAQCGNCDSLAQSRHRTQPHCLLDSDFYGDMLVDADHVCTRWSLKQTQRAITRLNETEAAIAAERVAMARDLQAMLAGGLEN